MFSSHGGGFEILAAPRLVWDAYVTYLVKYEPDSWVATTVTAFRVMAILLLLPIIILTLLDITSYVIARTLGVVDDVKAATSDKPSIPAICISSADGPSSLPADASSPSASTSGSSFSIISHSDSQPGGAGPAVSLDERLHPKGTCAGAGDKEDRGERPEAYFATDDTAPLSGVGVFSPAASQPASPVLTRARLEHISSSESISAAESQDEGVAIRRRAPPGLAMTARGDA